ncbi:Transmembrane protein 35like [Caligus rogercresseyi]|uniref:Novel acetylcholine receptor chaperone n=1 Tax=Caligus rogercresseyi TaxID=217165 RepID=A0A7T8KE33_CALRO|nr:Transmembrane protein 35like [Caligus rogercresseyi]|eukprot:TRINITY_DN18595_c0_g1_i1.p1 TRINITY_DN18595_c0_g1~~TRINITY_DN18595_c0_g1_i1.p1  ORF type:complete len:158 (+),score=42.53 TRINITY_DN18595_c0_g1_i1:122-595(+)
MSKIVLKSLSILLGAFFIFLGTLKITPKISRDLHKDLRTEYAKYAKVFPFIKTLEVKLPSKWYRRSVGALEIFCGIIMSALPHRKSKNIANILLLGLKTLNVYSHWAINDAFERTAPSLVFFLMLCCRLVVDWQLSKKKKEPSPGITPTATVKKKEQ